MFGFCKASSFYLCVNSFAQYQPISGFSWIKACNVKMVHPVFRKMIFHLSFGTAEVNEPEKDLEANNNNTGNSSGVCKCTYGQISCPRCKNLEMTDSLTEGARNRQKKQKKAERMNSVRLTKPLVVSSIKILHFCLGECQRRRKHGTKIITGTGTLAMLKVMLLKWTEALPT